MAELTTPAATTANSCCAPEAQATCCEPSAKAECCDPSHARDAAAPPTPVTTHTGERHRSQQASVACSAVAVDSDHGPDRLHDAEGPRSREEPVGA